MKNDPVTRVSLLTYGDNAGDSVGPTADGFETYGVTGVALIAFITLAL